MLGGNGLRQVAQNIFSLELLRRGEHLENLSLAAVQLVGAPALVDFLAQFTGAVFNSLFRCASLCIQRALRRFFYQGFASSLVAQTKTENA